MRSRNVTRLAVLAAVGLALATAALAAGCGSSGTAPGAASAVAPAASATSTARTSTTGSTAPNASLKVSTVPKYGTPSSSTPIGGGTVQIAYRNITINPDLVRVKAGTTLRWTNYDSVEHNVTSESGPQRFVSRTFGEGKTFQVTLTKPGIYHYECTIHPTTMNGTIEVVR